ncbi:MAG: macro domain-containing protein, partial [Firmicutes bacterium]|nr:macro domain-containing protein [Bacillota bacterium]
MPFVIVRNDIVNMQADAIVNAANTNPVIGDGVDSAVHNRAGKELLAARKRIGVIPYGNTAITPAFGLDAKYVIHAVSPIWQGGTENELELLRKCYTGSLELALENNCKSIAFPLLSSGNHGFPKDLALHTAVNA